MTDWIFGAAWPGVWRCTKVLDVASRGYAWREADICILKQSDNIMLVTLFYSTLSCCTFMVLSDQPHMLPSHQHNKQALLAPAQKFPERLILTFPAYTKHMQGCGLLVDGPRNTHHGRGRMFIPSSCGQNIFREPWTQDEGDIRVSTIRFPRVRPEHPYRRGEWEGVGFSMRHSPSTHPQPSTHTWRDVGRTLNYFRECYYNPGGSLIPVLYRDNKKHSLEPDWAPFLYSSQAHASDGALVGFLAILVGMLIT